MTIFIARAVSDVGVASSYCSAILEYCAIVGMSCSFDLTLFFSFLSYVMPD